MKNRKRSQIVSNNKRTIMKPAVLNLTSRDIHENITSLLNLGPNSVQTPKSVLYMKIIITIESKVFMSLL